MRYAIASRLKRTGTAFPLYKKERERRSRAFPSDSNTAVLPPRWWIKMYIKNLNNSEWQTTGKQSSCFRVGLCILSFLQSFAWPATFPQLELIGNLKALQFTIWRLWNVLHVATGMVSVSYYSALARTLQQWMLPNVCLQVSCLLSPLCLPYHQRDLTYLIGLLFCFWCGSFFCC